MWKKNFLAYMRLREQKEASQGKLKTKVTTVKVTTTRSPSKSKKSKTFKFTTSKSKDKREKSRDKEKLDKDHKDDDKQKDKLDKDKHGDKDKEKEHKKKDKDKKDKKEKSKDKEKDKERKDKKEKVKHQSSINSEEVLELCSPVFGVSVSLATERSRCHDGLDLPLVVRDCIDYLQEHGLKNDQIYRVEPTKTRLQHFKRLYNNRERLTESDELDVPTACGLLKLFLKELPEPVLTTDLITRFEEVASHPKVTKQQEEITSLLEQLPKCNKILLSWLLLHFDSVIQHEKNNKLNAQSLAMLLSPPLQMSHRLLVTLLCYCPTLFPDVKLVKYVPPITSSSPKLPDTPEEIQKELCKQESLLNQIHSEMNAGYVTKKREEQLWEVQRIITQLKRKLKTFERGKSEKSIDEVEANDNDTVDSSSKQSSTTTNKSSLPKVIDVEQTTKLQKAVTLETTDNSISPKSNKDFISDANKKSEEYVSVAPPPVIHTNNSDGMYVDEETGLLMVSKSHPDYATLLRLQLGNQELLAWKSQLQARISAERSEILQLKQLLQQQMKNKVAPNTSQENVISPLPGTEDYERIVEHFMRENALLENKKRMLAKEIFEENKQCIALQVELAMQKISI
ncbi:ral interacting protein isoform X2 [Musca autumnalis]|uniref:ral interacting protein isoform X2 n=1 Tax=Musca autumnalis TaxID=221902 RepID=UPI003CFA9350